MKLVAALLLFAACGSEDPPAEPCQTEPLVWRTMADPGRVDVMNTLGAENGLHVLLVSASCEFYVYASEPGRSASLRHGWLSTEQAAALAADSARELWDDTTYSGDVADGGQQQLGGVVHGVACVLNCEGGNVPAWLTDALHRVNDWTTTLWRSAPPASGELHVEVFTWNRPPIYEVPLATWPLAEPVESHAATWNGVDRGVRFLVSGADAEAFRAQLEYYELRQHGGSFHWGYLPYRDDQEGGPPEYAVVIRDRFPLEDENGVLDLSRLGEL